jgi:hypothetical protein
MVPKMLFEHPYGKLHDDHSWQADTQANRRNVRKHYSILARCIKQIESIFGRVIYTDATSHLVTNVIHSM